MMKKKDLLKTQGYGEICIKGENVFSGYFNNKNLNKSKFMKDYFRSGDFGFLDKKIFFILNQEKTLIIKGGENIYPAEIENAIYKFDQVIECAVIGYNDEIYGEDICAFIKLKKYNKVSYKKLNSILIKNLAKFKIQNWFTF